VDSRRFKFDNTAHDATHCTLFTQKPKTLKAGDNAQIYIIKIVVYRM
jgi:hypothetical protein